MDSIYFEDPLGLLIELASYRFEPPHGFTHAEVLLEAHRLRVERGDYNIAEEHLADAIEALVTRSRGIALGRPIAEAPVPDRRHTQEEDMAAHTLNILKPSVNNLTAGSSSAPPASTSRSWTSGGRRRSPEYLAKYPAHLTPMLEEEGLPKGALGESCAIMAYLCNKHGLDRFYPTDPGERAMVDNAMFYLIGTLLPAAHARDVPGARLRAVPGRGRDARTSTTR